MAIDSPPVSRSSASLYLPRNGRVEMAIYRSDFSSPPFGSLSGVPRAYGVHVTVFVEASSIALRVYLSNSPPVVDGRSSFKVEIGMTGSSMTKLGVKRTRMRVRGRDRPRGRHEEGNKTEGWSIRGMRGNCFNAEEVSFPWK